MIDTHSATIFSQMFFRIRLFFVSPDLKLTMSFQTDLAMVEGRLAWVEWRIQVLKDDPVLMDLVRAVKADSAEFRQKFQTNAEEHSMIEESKEYGRVFLAGVLNSLFTDPFGTLGCSKAEKVGTIMEGLLYYGLLVENNGKALAIECFFLSRDMNEIFTCGQRYGWWTSPNYRFEDVLEVVSKMRSMRLNAQQPALTW